MEQWQQNAFETRHQRPRLRARPKWLAAISTGLLFAAGLALWILMLTPPFLHRN